MKLPWSNPLGLPPQLQWKYTDDQALMGWSIRSRNYNVAIANGMSIFFFFMVLVGSALAGDWFGQKSEHSYIRSIVFFFFIYPAMLSMTHQRMNFAYRISKSGFEYCGWKSFPKSAVIIVNGFAVIAGIFVIAIASTTPGGGLVGLVGAGGIGLTAVATVNSERFQKMHTEFFQVDFTWDEFNRISLYKSRHIIGLNHLWENEGKILPGVVNVFCRRRDFEDRLAMIESLLPKPIPVVVEKFEVY